MRWRWLRLVPVALGVCLAAAVAEAGSARSSFGVSAEVIRRCAIDGSAAADVRVACSKGTPAPRIGRGLRSGVPLATTIRPAPRAVESAGRDGATVQISVDF
jgi:hypothetical protein